MIHKIRRYGQIGLAFAVLALLSMILSGIVRSGIYAQSFFRSDVSKNAIAVKITDSKSDMKSFIEHLLKNENLASIDKLFSFSDVEAIWMRKALGKDYPLISGRYFTAEDLMSKERLAVVGKNRLEREAEKTSSSTAVFFDSQEYRVIGVIGNPNKETYLDDALYVNLLSLAEKTDISADGEYIFDFYNEPSAAAFMTSLKEYFNDENTLLERVPISEYRIDVASVLKNDDFVRLLTTTVIMVVFSSFCMALSWIQKRSSEIQIRKQIGASDISILVYLFSRFFVIGIVAFLIAFAAYANIHSALMEKLNYEHAELDIKLAFLLYMLCNIAAFLGVLPCMLALRSISPARKEFKF